MDAGSEEEDTLKALAAALLEEVSARESLAAKSTEFLNDTSKESLL